MPEGAYSFRASEPNKMIRTLGMILLLCVPVAITAQFDIPSRRFHG
jgi:hypothetical protein